MCVCICLHIWTGVCHVCACVFTCMYTDNTCVCVHVYVYAHRECMCVYTYLHILHVCVCIFPYSHRVFMCDFQHVYIRLSSPRGGVIVSKCHKWPGHERVLSRTFVVPEIVKNHERLAHEHVGFFALLISVHVLLLGYSQGQVGTILILSFFRRPILKKETLGPVFKRFDQWVASFLKRVCLGVRVKKDKTPYSCDGVMVCARAFGLDHWVASTWRHVSWESDLASRGILLEVLALGQKKTKTPSPVLETCLLASGNPP